MAPRIQEQTNERRRAMTFEEMWADLAPVGRSTRTGGYFRQPFTATDQGAYAWFVAESERRALRLQSDGYGNVAAWWDSSEGPGGLTDSHLDSVPDRSGLAGPLRLVSALAAISGL